MKLTFPTVYLFAIIISICSCSAGQISNSLYKETDQRTVTFRTINTVELNGPEKAIASEFLRHEQKYIPKYVEINYDSVNSSVNSLYSELNFWDRVKYGFSRKRQYRLYASVTGTDHLLNLDEQITYDTIRTVEESDRIWDHIWENSSDFTKFLVGANEAHFIRETYQINNIKYKLRYIDGYTGKTLWRMQYKWPSFFGAKKQNPVLMIKKKFERRFPYKIINKKNKHYLFNPSNQQ